MTAASTGARTPAQAEAASDEALWTRCRNGESAAWALLVRRYQRLVYTVPRRAGLGDAQCADVFQFSFAQLVEHMERIVDGSRVRAWLVTTARRESLRLLEQERRRVEPATTDGGWDGEADDDAMASLPDTAPLPDALLDELQQHHRLGAAVQALDERSRRFVELVFLQDEPLPYREVAVRLGIPEGSIGPTRARCLAKLRTLLDGE
jgi:RNA polymerase sigma factor (sigma-70 family)